MKHAEGSEIYYLVKIVFFLFKGVEGIFIQDGIEEKRMNFLNCRYMKNIAMINDDLY